MIRVVQILTALSLGHLLLWGFTGVAFWVPLDDDDVGRFMALFVTHTLPVVLWVALWATGDKP